MANHKKRARLAAAAAVRAADAARQPQAARELAELLYGGAARLTANRPDQGLEGLLLRELEEHGTKYRLVSVAISDWRLNAEDALKRARTLRQAGTEWRAIAREASEWTPEVEAAAPRGIGHAYGHPFHSDSEDEV